MEDVSNSIHLQSITMDHYGVAYYKVITYTSTTFELNTDRSYNLYIEIHNSKRYFRVLIIILGSFTFTVDDTKKEFLIRQLEICGREKSLIN